MKNKKFSWLLNIATICLCVCAIAIGVYSAKTASLTVSGTIVFSANDCMVEISGSYSAYSSATATSRTTTDLTTTTVGGKTASDYNKSLAISSALYFSDCATDGYGDEIVFNLTITNKSPFKITVKSLAPTLKNSSGGDVTSVTCTTSHAGFALEKDAYKTITLTYKLEDVDDASNITGGQFSITLNFEKWSQFYTESVTELFTDYTGSTESDVSWNEVTTTKLCTTMGHSIVGTGAGTDGETEIPIQWYAFAVKGVNTGKGYVYNNTWYARGTNNGDISDRWYSLNGINFNEKLEMIIGSNTISSKGQTFWFIQQYVTAGGYYMGKNSSDYVDGIEYMSSYISNYASSDLFKTLTTETDGTYLSTTRIKDDGLYTRIDNREIEESYAVGDMSDSSILYTQSFKIQSKLWLISASELGLITNKKTTNSGFELFNLGSKTSGIGNQELIKSYNTRGADWWLRSPCYYDETCMNIVNSIGQFDAENTMNEFGIRAAFQISIEA